jgi:hypothetical protein
VLAMGVPVVTASTWAVAGGDPKKLRPTCVIHHAPAARAKAREFVYTPQFAENLLDVLNALRDCVAFSKSVWNVKPLTPNPQPLAGGVERIQLTSLASLGQVKASSKQGSWRGGVAGHMPQICVRTCTV